MPKGDGTGPRGQGPETGKGMKGQGKGGGGRGGGFAKGPGGYCGCLDCGEKATHQQGTPCYEQKCPSAVRP
ncbi:MAG: hypothetical protein U9N83_18335 [Thermodesulfobacteriota bacterium]|nr:hypothetical protein [Thermodesulfobacteriota bacterium]